MLATLVTDPDPLFLQSTVPEMMGQFTCNDTDISALGADSPLAGTCTCWYAGLPTVSDVFVKPDGGCAMVKPSQDPKTN
jgi:hypothetical protein